MASILQPPEKTVFQSLLSEFKETQYASYFNAPLGKCRDPNPGLPKQMPEMKPRVPRIKAEHLINPPKTHGQVNFENELAHDLYVKSHQDYDPGEKMIRFYKSDNFSVNKTFGHKTNANWRGIGVPRCLNWCNQANVTAVSSVLADFIYKNSSPIGKGLVRDKELINNIPEIGFGKFQPLPFYGMKELLNEAPPCNLSIIRLEWLKFVNHLRLLLKKRNFPYSNFLEELLVKDLGQGHINEKELMNLCKKYNLSINFKEIDPLLYYLKIRNENDKLIKISDFWNLINWKCEFPDLGKLEDMSPVYQHLDTEYNTMTDIETLKKNIEDLPTFGKPSISLSTGLPKADLKCDLDSLSEETTARALINPNIYTQYGLSHRDFFLPRNETEMRTLIKAFGWKIPDEVFEELWRIGSEQDTYDKKGETNQDSLCCLETFRNLLDRLICEHLTLQQ